MAKWDLSKLPEGRKPLPDEWFAERAQMQERIEELEVKLAKAVEALYAVEGWSNNPAIEEFAGTTIAELTSSEAADNEVKGGKDE